MRTYDLNSYPHKIREGVITKREAVNYICSFITENYKVFNLQNYDEDFRSELIISFLEKGEKFIDSYNPDMGDFFTFLYCYVRSMITTRIRCVVKRNLKDSVTIQESVNSFLEKQYRYNTLSYSINEIPKVPYSHKKIEFDELKQVFANVGDDFKDKKILVLALKSSAYITDDQIEKVCSLYKIKPEDFYKTIEYLKNQITVKFQKHQKAEERRNFDYYHRKKYTLELSKLLNSEKREIDSLEKKKILQKRDRHDCNWKRMNRRLEKGFLYLRPSTKSVAEILGICERQVNYLLNCAKKEVKELQEKEKYKIQNK